MKFFFGVFLLFLRTISEVKNIPESDELNNDENTSFYVGHVNEFKKAKDINIGGYETFPDVKHKSSGFAGVKNCILKNIPFVNCSHTKYYTIQS